MLRTFLDPEVQEKCRFVLFGRKQLYSTEYRVRFDCHSIFFFLLYHRNLRQVDKFFYSNDDIAMRGQIDNVQ